MKYTCSTLNKQTFLERLKERVIDVHSIESLEVCEKGEWVSKDVLSFIK